MKPKRLSLAEMWKLYNNLRSGLGTRQEYLVDEIFDILSGISKEDFLFSLLLLYPKMEFAKHNPVEMSSLFISGLKKNGFFVFVDVVEGLKGGNSKR